MCCKFTADSPTCQLHLGYEALFRLHTTILFCQHRLLLCFHFSCSLGLYLYCTGCHYAWATTQLICQRD